MIRLGQALILSLGIVIAAALMRAPHVEFDLPEPQVVHLHHLEAPKLSDADERLFGRLQARIDARVEERLVSAMEEATGEKRTGVGTLLAAAVGKLVAKAIKAVIAAVIFSVLLSLAWKYCWWVIPGFVVAVALVAAPVSWVVSRRK